MIIVIVHCSVLNRCPEVKTIQEVDASAESFLELMTTLETVSKYHSVMQTRFQALGKASGENVTELLSVATAHQNAMQDYHKMLQTTTCLVTDYSRKFLSKN